MRVESPREAGLKESAWETSRKLSAVPDRKSGPGKVLSGMRGAACGSLFQLRHSARAERQVLLW